LPGNRYGYPGHLPEFGGLGGFEVNFLPEYKALHDAGYNVLAYDLPNHGMSGQGNGGIAGIGLTEYRDVIGSLRYAASTPDTTTMKKALLSVCLAPTRPPLGGTCRWVAVRCGDHGTAHTYTVCCMPHVDYVIQYVASLERSMTFYRDVIGLKVRIEGDGYVEFEMDNTKFSLFERSKLPELIGREAGKAPCGEIGFIIDDVDTQAERLKGLGVEILTGPMDRPWGERTLHISDPDGNIIEFAQKLR
jgi:lactoylglutathione lyase